MTGLIIIIVIVLLLIEVFITHAAEILVGITAFVLLFLCFGAVIHFILNRFPEDETDGPDTKQPEEAPVLKSEYHSEYGSFDNELDMAKDNLDIARRKYNAAMAEKRDIVLCGNDMMLAKVILNEIDPLLAGYKVNGDADELKRIINRKNSLAQSIENDFNMKIKSLVNSNYEEFVASIRKSTEKREYYCEQFRTKVLSYVIDNCDPDVCEFAFTCYHDLKNKKADIEDNSNLAIEKNNVSMSVIDSMSGQEFERFCAKLLARNGFKKIVLTKGSGDQGVDILAEKDGIRYAIQCKNYNSDLGNTPVQEVNTGKIIYNCHVGVVLTNRGFTSGAITAADKTGIILWGRDELRKMMENTKEFKY